MASLHSVTVTRVFPSSRPMVWALVADTNRWDRAAGLQPAKYEWRREGVKNIRIAETRELGMRLVWEEPPYRWLEGRSVDGERRFLEGPVSRGGFKVELTDLAPVNGVPQTQVTATAWVEAPLVIGVMQKRKFSTALEAYFGGLAALLGGTAEHRRDPSVPAVVDALRAVGSKYHAVASGPRSGSDDAQLQARLKRFSKAPVDPALVERFATFLREAPDEQLASIQPFELAARWGLPKRDVLRAFLHATQTGLVELRWQVNCPTCRVGAATHTHLGEVGRGAHCGACDVKFDVDFGDHVEAVFPVHPAIRKVQTALYCASSPAFLPHVFAQFRVPRGESLTVAADFDRGHWLVRTLYVRKRAVFDTLEGRPARARIEITSDGITATTDGLATGDTPTELTVVNRSDDEAAVLVERTSWSAASVLGSVIASFPEFTTLFATEAPASGIDLRIGHLALLFSDLTGSTALYERVGDARAFAIVENHFRVSFEAIEANGGAVVKTMGDAVMACFADIGDAIRAGRAMVRAHNEAMGELDLTVKIGVHSGPCIAVRANDRLDYFGTTVNMTARLQAKAEPNEIVVTRDVLEEPLVRDAFGELPSRVFGATLKGIQHEQKLVAFDAK